MKKKGRTGVGSVAKYCLNCIKTAMHAYGYKKFFTGEQRSSYMTGGGTV